MRKIFIILLILALCIVSVNSSFAKSKKVKFGKVNITDLQMTIYDLDTSAVAVILYEKGYYDDVNNQFHSLRRIKILKKEGLSFANYVFNTGAKSFIKGITFNLEDGKIIARRISVQNRVARSGESGIPKTPFYHPPC